MAKVPNGVETLPKISIAWVGRTNVTDDRRTDGFTTAYSERERELNARSFVNVRLRSLKAVCIGVDLKIMGLLVVSSMPVGTLHRNLCVHSLSVLSTQMTNSVLVNVAIQKNRFVPSSRNATPAPESNLECYTECFIIIDTQSGHVTYIIYHTVSVKCQDTTSLKWKQLSSDTFFYFIRCEFMRCIRSDVQKLTNKSCRHSFLYLEVMFTK